MFPELNRLFQFIEKHQLMVTYDGVKTDDLLAITLHSKQSVWNLYIEDEYGYFDLRNQPLCVYLTLRALLDYIEMQDFLQWTNNYGLKTTDHWLNYYRELSRVFPSIESELGTLVTFISDLDYQLYSGAFYALIGSIE
jgi:hypothetical protein